MCVLRRGFWVLLKGTGLSMCAHTQTRISLTLSTSRVTVLRPMWDTAPRRLPGTQKSLQVTRKLRKQEPLANALNSEQNAHRVYEEWEWLGLFFF